jgi:hypothetical protein
MNFSIFAVTSFVLGLIGATLGVVNSVRQLLAARVRMRIRCYFLTIIQPGDKLESCFCIEIANLSAFPLTVTKIHFKPKNRQIGLMWMLDDGCLDGEKLPRRIDPRDSIQVCYKNVKGAEIMLGQTEFALVETACGEMRKGMFPVFGEPR